MKNQGNDSKMIEENALVLVVDDDTDICDVLRQMISCLGIRVETTLNPLEVLDLVRGGFYNVILLDIRMPEKSGMELLPEIVEVSPDTKIIVISGFGDKDSAISALRLGAFDFLEKPFEYKLLSHSIQRALKTQKTELAYKNEKKKFHDANRRLAENNEALSTLARNIERSRNDFEANIEKKIRVSILPIIENLQQGKVLSQNHQHDLELLMDLMADLTSTLDVKQDLFTVLTPTELRTALLIRNGLITDEIAKHMHISPETVKSHRKNIRKKLGLNKSHHNLRAHLQATPGR
ncbi:MAG: response regulator [Proteobacteria bacterium]|nr:response regulator [Pseudomonadota bacterium]